jgi:hypothetical protein
MCKRTVFSFPMERNKKEEKERELNESKWSERREMQGTYRWRKEGDSLG